MEFSSFFISFSRWPSGGSSDILSQKNVSLRSPRAAAKVRLTHALVSTPVLAAGLGLASQETPPVHNEQIRDSKSGERWNHPQGMNLAREFPEGLTELRTAPHLRPLPPSFLLPPPLFLLLLPHTCSAGQPLPASSRLFPQLPFQALA